MLLRGFIASLFVIGVGGLLLSHFFQDRALAWRVIDWQSGQGQEHLMLPPDLLPDTDVTLADTKVRWFKQAVAGVPVEGAFVKTVERSEKVVLARGQVVDGAQLPSPATVLEMLKDGDGQSGVRNLSLQKQGCRESNELAPALKYYNGRWRLIYQADCERGFGVVRIAFVTDGKLFRSETVSYEFSWNDASVVLYPRGPMFSQLQALTLPVSSDPTFLQTPNMSVRSDAGLSFADIKTLNEVTPTDPRFDMVQAYHYVKGALDWAQQTLNVQLTELRVRTHVGHPDRASVAFYYSSEVRLGTGDNVSFRNMTWDPTVVVHETMHAVVEKLTRMPFQGEAGSLSEALADSLTAFHLRTPKMGESSYLTGPYQRSLEQRVLLQDKNKKLYHDSLILSGTIWQLREEVDEQTALDLTIFLLARLTPSYNLEKTKGEIQSWFNNCSSGEVCHRIGTILNARGWL